MNSETSFPGPQPLARQPAPIQPLAPLRSASPGAFSPRRIALDRPTVDRRMPQRLWLTVNFEPETLIIDTDATMPTLFGNQRGVQRLS